MTTEETKGPTGSELGPYRLLFRLGSGGMGTVYVAEVAGPMPPPAADLAPGSRVALKLIHPGLLDQPGLLSRFRREAAIGKSIHHPNVVRTYDACAHPHAGQCAHFLVMEYVEGQTLRSLLGELGRVPEELCRHVGREVAKGLAAVHAAGAVHRDIKPENVLITRDEIVKVMDLGVAWLEADAVRLSHTGTFVGSVHYAAPEQFQGLDQDVDGRADLYALGVVLYELATGRHPFGDGDYRRVIHRVLNERPRRAGELNPQLSPFFEEVVHTLLEKNRDLRFGSAAELVEVLDQGEELAWWRDRTRAIRLATRRPLRRIRIPKETALYGRDAELTRLGALFAEAKAGGGQILLIEGEAGIGKSRLVDEFVNRLFEAGEDLNFLFGSYPPGGAATATGAFTTAYREHFGTEHLEETLAHYLPVTPLLVPAVAALLRGDAPPGGAEGLTKDSLQTVLVHATRGLAAERPTIILIDDLHFAPAEGLALFAALVLALPEHRVLLIGTARPGLPEDWVAGVERLDHTTRMALERLEAKDLALLLLDAFRTEKLATELGLAIATRSDGNPFFALEIIRELRESELIVRERDGTWVAAQEIQEIQIPASILDLIRARIGALGEEDRDLLEVAACLGFEFDPALVAEAAGLGVLPALRRCGRIERRHRLIHTAGRRFLFDHHQVQEVLYAGISPQLRERYHRALAEALEAREGAGDQEPRRLEGAVAVPLCEHFLRGGCGARALRYLDSALDHLEGSHFHAAAVDLADRALAAERLLGGEKRANLLVRKAKRLGLLGRRPEERVVLEEALILAERTGGPRTQARVELSLGVHLAETAHFEEALPVLSRALALARDAGDRHQEAAGTGNLGIVLAELGRLEEAQAHHERNLALAREIGDRRGEAAASGNLGLVLLDLGRFAEARAYRERHLEIAREIGDRRSEATAIGNLGNLCVELGQYEEAKAWHERHLTLAREIGHRRGEAMATGNLGLVFAALGEYGEAVARCERHLALSREIGHRRGEAIALGNLGLALGYLGETERARTLLGASRSLFLEAHMPSSVALVLHDRGVVETLAGDPAAAERFHFEGLAIQRGIDFAPGVAVALAALGGLAARSGRAAEARVHLAEALCLCERIELPGVEVGALVHLALLPGGDPARAIDVLAAREPRLKRVERIEARFVLWKATSDSRHLEEAHRLLTSLRDHAPAAYRETMIAHVRIHREIVEAWEAAEAQAAGRALRPGSESARLFRFR